MSYKLVCDAYTETPEYSMLGFSVHADAGTIDGGAKMEFVPDQCIDTSSGNPLLEHGIAVGKNGVVIIPTTYLGTMQFCVQFSDGLRTANVTGYNPGQEYTLVDIE